ncbi:MAG TPA: acyltransferase [Gemmataceae bacterium]|jgi:acetyltransferase-like isoleucine patch superfamily enzyme
MKNLLRESAVFVAVALTAPCWLLVRVQQALARGKQMFAGCSEFLSMFPGLPGVYLRRGFYRMTLEACASDCHIGFGTTFAHPQARIGRGVYVGNRCMFGMVVIGDHATIGSNVDVLSGRRQHGFASLDAPIQEQGVAFERVHLGRNCWIGNSTVIMADVADDCVIGAGSVVVKPIPPRSVAVGNPATVKRRRDAMPYPHEDSDRSSRMAAKEGVECTGY